LAFILPLKSRFVLGIEEPTRRGFPLLLLWRLVEGRHPKGGDVIVMIVVLVEHLELEIQGENLTLLFGVNLTRLCGANLTRLCGVNLTRLFGVVPGNADIGALF
jgi:hypothetical protein